MSAPDLDASVEACRSRESSPMNATAGSSGGASGSGAMTAERSDHGERWSEEGGGGVPYTLASHPAVTVMMATALAAVTDSSVDGRPVHGPPRER